MLICPQCAFENPNCNRFCQKCGQALQIWQGILIPTTGEGDDTPINEADNPPSRPLERAIVADPAAERQPVSLSYVRDLKAQSGFLDKQQRYQIASLSPRPEEQSVEEMLDTCGYFLFQIIDCQPGADSPLLEIKNLCLQNPQIPFAEIEQNRQIPAAAWPYLALQANHFPAIPELQDAWKTSEYSLLLIEDRSHWQPLLEAWRQVASDPLQQLHWLFEMTLLWEALSPWQLQGSLLHLPWLCIDEDQILGLSQINPYRLAQGENNVSTAPNLQDLANLWQDLLQLPGNQDDPSPLQALVEAILTEDIVDLKEIQNRLAHIAESLSSKTATTSEALAETADAFMEALPSGFEATVKQQGDSLVQVPGQEEVAFSDEDPPRPENPAITVAPGIRQEQQDNPEFFPSSTSDLTPADGDGGRASPLLLNSTASLENTASEDTASEDTASEDTASEDTDFLDADVDTDLLLNLESDSVEDMPDLPTMVLPMKMARLDEVGRTHVGRQRKHNEDFFYAQTQSEKVDTPTGPRLYAKGLYILCDGMGGHASGEVASSLAVKTLQTYFAEHWQETLPDEESLLTGVLKANEAIYSINQTDARSGSGRMGTTLVMMLLQDMQAIVVHVGDSRLYTYNRRQGLQQITQDHEVGQREIQRGVEPAIAYARPDAYQLTQALGPRNTTNLNPGFTSLEIVEDTLFILCSDGLSDNDLLEKYADTHIEPLIHSKADLDEGINELINLANEENGHDNVTIILIRAKVSPNLES